jgi:hypothetical protein
VGAWSRSTCTDGVIDDSSGLVSLTGSWRFSVRPGWIAASAQGTTHHGDWLETTRAYPVRRLGVVALTCPTCGSVALYIGGHKVGGFSLATTTTKRRTLLLPRWTTARKGVVRVVVTSPTDRLVRLDGVVVSSL